MPEIASAPAPARNLRRRFRQFPGNPPWAVLLQGFYARAGLKVPAIELVAPDKMPRVYCALLAHSEDMTPTLETFYADRLALTVLNREVDETHYHREVVLSLATSERPVAYGVIRIHLSNLPQGLLLQVLDERRPFGNILQTEAVPHISWPQNFFRTAPDGHMAEMLRQTRPRPLFGRRNLLLDGSRRLLAEVIEVLAPVQAALHLPE